MTIATGATSANITVNTTHEVYYEPDEVMYVVLSNPVNGTITTATGNGTILNNDTVPYVNFNTTYNGVSE
ncbi:MAG: hypothetical protein H6765_10215 [Candidatus Peribacteria bacterium]|nr:MAG: hypothetical protein H6765_10215 [Candidatus Peribacteria bacterium]